MTAQIIDGKTIAKQVHAETAQAIEQLKAQGITPGLATVLVGDDPASATYVRNKQRRAQKLGLHTVEHHLSAQTSQGDLQSLLAQLNADPAIDGVLLQLPLPEHLDADLALANIDPDKDVDGLLATNLGRLAAGLPGLVACTPLGCMRLIEATGLALAGTRAIVVGRSTLVGKPMAQLLLARDCTVTMAHSKTQDLAARVAEADLVIVAVGRAELVQGAWIKAGATVIDVGTNRLEDGRLVGDVDFASAVEQAAWISPVPGGVGPMTIAMLMANTVKAARLRRGGVR